MHEWELAEEHVIRSQIYKFMNGIEAHITIEDEGGWHSYLWFRGAPVAHELTDAVGDTLPPPLPHLASPAGFLHFRANRGGTPMTYIPMLARGPKSRARRTEQRTPLTERLTGDKAA